MTTTDLVPVEAKKQVLTVQQAANILDVTSPDTAKIASDILHDIKEATRVLTEKKTDVTRPMMTALANVKALFAPLELALADANKMVRAKMLAYTIEEQDRIDTAKAKIATRVEKGTMRSDTAVAKLGAVGDVAKTEGIRVQSRRQLEIVDESLIPREYLVPNRDAISKALFADIVVPGCELKNVKILNVV